MWSKLEICDLHRQTLSELWISRAGGQEPELYTSVVYRWTGCILWPTQQDRGRTSRNRVWRRLVETTFTSSTASPQFKMGKILWRWNKSRCYPQECASCILGTRNKKGVMFGVRYLDEGLHKGENIVWVKIKYLYHFYQKAALDLSRSWASGLCKCPH